MRWADRVDQLLYDGERVEHRLEIATAEIVVTSHRVLTFPSGGDGPAYRHVNLPNVGAVDLRRTGRIGYLVWTFVSALLGIGLLVTSVAVSFVDLVPTPDLESGETNAPTNPADGILSAVESTLALVDLAVVVTGVLSLTIAAAFALLYVRSRSRRLVIEVRGDDDVELPVAGTDDVGAAVIELEEAIRPEPSLGAIDERTPNPDRDRLEDGSTADDRHRTVRERVDSPLERNSLDDAPQQRGPLEDSPEEQRSLEDSSPESDSPADGLWDRDSVDSGEPTDSPEPTADFSPLESAEPPTGGENPRTDGLDGEESSDAFEWDPLEGSGSAEEESTERNLESERWWSNDDGGESGGADEDGGDAGNDEDGGDDGDDESDGCGDEDNGDAGDGESNRG
ncbi:hypothetical protein AB7C87_14240 [Natrarchaeobius sp. A-rgal3]|uniref:hypothetical protein n=1 Tax=Natrarchaeobius versutus TaxID=1679078 RepID=UPI00351053FE